MPRKQLGNPGVLIFTRIIEASQKPVAIEVERLLGGVCHHARRKPEPQATPGIRVHAFPLELLRRNVRFSEDEWYGEVVPDRVATVVGQLQLIPDAGPEALPQLLPRSLPLFEQLTVRPLEHHPIRPV